MTARKNDAKKEVDTARRRAYLFFCCPFSVGRFPWAAFPWRLDDAAPVADRTPPPLLSGQAAPRRRPAPGR